MLKATMKAGWVRLALAVLGSLIYALGINLFVTPLGLYTGGLMGFCQLLRTVILTALHISSLPLDLAGIIFYAINVPLLAVAWKSMGPIFFRNTVICATTYTLFVSLVPVPAQPLVDDILTSCLLGGVISGVGTGLVLTCGCSGGGLDALGLHLSRKGAKFTIGQFNLVFNAVLFLLCGLLFDVSTMIYSILNTIFQAVAIDRAHQQSVNVPDAHLHQGGEPGAQPLHSGQPPPGHHPLGREGGLHRRGYSHPLRMPQQVSGGGPAAGASQGGPQGFLHHSGGNPRQQQL